MSERDIVDELRVAAHHRHNRPGPNEWLLCAAYEIERLRAEAADLRAHLDLRKGCCLEAEELTAENERLRAEVARLDEQNGNLRKRLDLIAGWASSMSLIVKGGALPLD